MTAAHKHIFVQFIRIVDQFHFLNFFSFSRSFSFSDCGRKIAEIKIVWLKIQFRTVQFSSKRSQTEANIKLNRITSQTALTFLSPPLFGSWENEATDFIDSFLHRFLAAFSWQRQLSIHQNNCQYKLEIHSRWMPSDRWPRLEIQRIRLIS